MKKIIILLILAISFSCDKEDDINEDKYCGIVFNKPGDTGSGCSNTTAEDKFIIGVSFNGIGDSRCVDQETFNSLEIGDKYCEDLN